MQLAGGGGSSGRRGIATRRSIAAAMTGQASSGSATPRRSR